MKGSEFRDRERKKEVLELFKPKKNGVYLHHPQRGKVTPEHDEEPGEVRAFTLDEITVFGKDFV